MMVTADSSLDTSKRNGEFTGYPRPSVPILIGGYSLIRGSGEKA
jgi:hypothetical protein